MIRKTSMRVRLTFFAVLLLIMCCAGMSLLMSNSALFRMRFLEEQVLELSIPSTAFPDTAGDDSVVMNFTLANLMPDLEETFSQSRSLFLRQSIEITLLIVLVGAVLTWFITRVELRPLERLSSGIDRITENNLHERLPDQDIGDEIGKLTGAFNRLLDRLDEAFQEQRRFAANAAHELRTPLAVMQTKLEVLDKEKDVSRENTRETISSLLQQTERLSTLVNVLLQMQGLDTVSQSDEIILDDLIDEVLLDLSQVADGMDVSLSRIPGGGKITGSDGLIYRAVYNLVENAVKYNLPGGLVEVKNETVGDTVEISVCDTGSGIAPEEQQRIFQPFYRIDKSRSRAMGGAGLGLALVQRIAAVHGGRVYVADSSCKGTRIVIELPITKS